MIRLYDDHLTISNPGHLAYQLHADDLLREHGSYPTNKLIAESFYNVGIIEHRGTGTILIANALKAQGLPLPEFDVSSPYTFKVTIIGRAAQMKAKLEAMDLNERQLKAMDYLRSNGILTSAAFQRIVEASKPTATRDLSDLLKKGLIIRGWKTGKGTSYRLAEPF